MKKFLTYIVLYSALISSVIAEDIMISGEGIKPKTSEEINEQLNPNKEVLLLNCKKHKNPNNCSNMPVYSDKMINENDIFYIEQRTYMDNYNPLFFNQSPTHIRNEFYINPR